MAKSTIWQVVTSALLVPSIAAAQAPALLAPDGTPPSDGTEDRIQPSSPGIPLGTPPRRPATGRYRYQGGRWWYLSRHNVWSVWENGRWNAVPQPSRQPLGNAAPVARSPAFERRFATYRGYQIGQARLQTAEAGDVELATDEVAEPGVEAAAAEVMTIGGIPRRQAERTHAGIHRAAVEERPEWFQTGSPFGIRYGYGSGFGYSGYGYNNPYGYGPRTGSGGAFSYGFGPYGAVGGQTSSRMTGVGAGGPHLISAEPFSLGAPSQLEKGPVGGTVTRAARRKLGGSASSSSGPD